jgi:hypothetical protein
MNVDIQIPTSLEEITLGQYQEYLKVTEQNTDEEFIAQKMISIFCNIKMSYVQMIKYSDAVAIINTITKMFENKPKLVQRFKIQDIEFGFIPNLEDMSFGEYIDLETNIGDWQSMNKAMAVMYRPIVKTKKEQYEIAKYTGTELLEEVMKFAPLSVVFSSMLFFWNLSKDLLQGTMDYLEEEITEMNTHSRHNLEVNGDGIIQSIHSLKATLEDLMQLPSYQLGNALHS